MLAGLTAHAHGRFPASVSVTERAGSRGQDILIGTTFGIVISRDAGQTWTWVCDESIGYARFEDPRPLWLQSGTILLPTSEGLRTSTDGGCNFGVDPVIGAADVGGVDASDPLDVLAVATVGSSTGALYRSSGGPFEVSELSRPRAIMSGVKRAPSAPSRVYVSGWFYRPSASWILKSDDGGHTFETFEQALPDPGLLQLMAVSPVDPDVILIRSGGTQGESVYRSSDGGRTVELAMTSTLAVRDARFSPDGQTVWLSTTERLHRSADAGRTFEVLPSPFRNACSGWVGGELWVCGWPWTDGFAVGRSVDGRDFETAWALNEIQGISSCPESSAAARVCGAFWPLVAEQLGIGEEPEPGEPNEPSCGCRAISPDVASSWLLGGALLALFARAGASRGAA